MQASSAPGSRGRPDSRKDSTGSERLSTFQLDNRPFSRGEDDTTKPQSARALALPPSRYANLDESSFFEDEGFTYDEDYETFDDDAEDERILQDSRMMSEQRSPLFSGVTPSSSDLAQLPARQLNMHTQLQTAGSSIIGAFAPPASSNANTASANNSNNSTPINNNSGGNNGMTASIYGSNPPVRHSPPRKLVFPPTPIDRPSSSRRMFTDDAALADELTDFRVRRALSHDTGLNESVVGDGRIRREDSTLSEGAVMEARRGLSQVMERDDEGSNEVIKGDHLRSDENGSVNIASKLRTLKMKRVRTNTASATMRDPPPLSAAVDLPSRERISSAPVTVVNPRNPRARRLLTENAPTAALLNLNGPSIIEWRINGVNDGGSRTPRDDRDKSDDFIHTNRSDSQDSTHSAPDTTIAASATVPPKSKRQRSIIKQPNALASNAAPDVRMVSESSSVGAAPRASPDKGPGLIWNIEPVTPLATERSDSSAGKEETLPPTHPRRKLNSRNPSFSKTSVPHSITPTPATPSPPSPSPNPSSNKTMVSGLGGATMALGRRGGETRTGGDSDANYMQSADFKRSDAPEIEMRRAFKDLKDEDWSTRFEALNSIRRLAIWHADLLGPNLQTIAREMKNEIDSLRSSLARNALMCCVDMFEGLKRQVDPELPWLVPLLLKKAGETNMFLAEEANRALCVMLRYCTESKTLAALLNHCNDTHKVVKQSAANYLSKAVEIMGARIFQLKDLPKLIQALGVFLTGAAVEMRTHAKLGVVRLAQLQGMVEFDKNAKKLLPQAHYAAVRKVLDKGLNQDLSLDSFRSMGATLLAPSTPSSLSFADTGSFSNAPVMGGTLEVPSSASRKTRSMSAEPAVSRPGTESKTVPPPAAKRRNVSGKKSGSDATAEESEQLAPIYSSLDSQDWRERMNGIDRLMAWLEGRPSCTPAVAVKICDHFAGRLGDNNGKVNAAALKVAERLIEITKDHLNSTLVVLGPALADNLSNSNAALRKMALGSLEKVPLLTDANTVVPVFGPVATYGNVKIKPTILDLLATSVSRTPDVKISALTKHIVPLCFSMLGENKTELRQANMSLLRAVHRVMGSMLLDSSLTNKLPPAHIQKLQAFVAGGELT